MKFAINVEGSDESTVIELILFKWGINTAAYFRVFTGEYEYKVGELLGAAKEVKKLTSHITESADSIHIE